MARHSDAGLRTVSRMGRQGWVVIECIPQNKAERRGRWRAKWVRETARQERAKHRKVKVKAFRMGGQKHLCVLVKKR